MNTDPKLSKSEKKVVLAHGSGLTSPAEIARATSLPRSHVVRILIALRGRGVLPLSCAHCERPATCMGCYETSEIWESACDECCGHGCEDGQCYPIAEIPERVVNAIVRQQTRQDTN